MDIAAQYNNRALVPDHPAIIARWHAEAAAFRGTQKDARLDLRYGARPRNVVDAFGAGKASDPLVVFIHGGYWRSFEKSVFSHVAAGAMGHGLQVAIPSYTLCPDVGVPDIIDELRQCCLFLHREFGRPLLLAGHSAGGHLAVAMAATNWAHFGAPAGLVRGCLAISGIFDMRPLLVTPMNDDLRLSPETALMASPLAWPMPNRFPVSLWMGGEESDEFKRQSASLAAAWTGIGLDVTCTPVPGANHFNVVNELERPDSAVTRALGLLARR